MILLNTMHDAAYLSCLILVLATLSKVSANSEGQLFTKVIKD